MEFQNVEQLENALADANAQVQILLRQREQNGALLVGRQRNMLANFEGMMANHIEAVHRMEMERFYRVHEGQMEQADYAIQVLRELVPIQREISTNFNQLLLALNGNGHIAARAGPPAAQVANPAPGAQVIVGGPVRRRGRHVADAAAGQRRGIPNKDVVYKQRVIGKGQDFDPATGRFTSFICTADNCHVATNTSRDLRMHFRNSHKEQ